MRTKKVKLMITIILIFILIFNISFPVMVKALASDVLISLGTGNYYIEVTKTTTVDDIIRVLGEPKLTTPSAFGGEAYTFYTDDNYDNYLYIETIENGKIVSFGSIDETYKTQTYSYGDDYPYNERSPLFGCLFSKEGTVGGGVYYNRYIGDNNEYVNYTDVIELYETNYTSNSTKYLKGLSEQAILMYNALSLKLGNRETAKFEFNEEYFYINEQFKEFGTSIREYMLDADLSTQYMKGIGVKSNVEIANKVYYIINPLLFADLAGNNRYTIFSDKTNAVFDYDVNRKILYAVTLSDDAFERTEKIDYTSEEQEKLEKGREKYNEAIQKFNEAGSLYEIEPQIDEPSELVAGKLNVKAQEAVTSYVNAIRAGAGVADVEINNESFDVAQHKSTLISYRYWNLGLDITHSPEQPEGVTDEFYKTAMGNGYGYAENVGVVGSSTNAKTIMNSINIFIDDSSETPQLFSHRQKILSNEYKNFGYGISPNIATNEFSGTNNDYTNFLEAWPSNGITFMETLVSPRFQWTAQFIDKYTVQDTTTATVKCINTGDTWEFTEQENTTNRWFACHTDSISALNNKVVIYDSSIVPQAGYVYEITLHDLKEDATGKDVDYTYRSVFEYADVSNYADTINSIEIEEPELDKDGEIYQTTVGEEIKLNAKIDDTEVIDKKLTWTSSNEDVIEVKQNGKLIIKKESDEPVTIRVSSDANGLSDSIQIKVNEKPAYLKGDLNNDGIINILDITYGYVKLEYDDITDEELERGDVTGEGVYNISDINKMYLYLEGKIDNL